MLIAEFSAGTYTSGIDAGIVGWYAASLLRTHRSDEDHTAVGANLQTDVFSCRVRAWHTVQERGPIDQLQSGGRPKLHFCREESFEAPI